MSDTRAPKDFPQWVRNELLKEIAASGTSECTALYIAVRDGAGNWPVTVGLHYKALLLARLDWIKDNVKEPVSKELACARALYKKWAPSADVGAAVDRGDRDGASITRLFMEAYIWGRAEAVLTY